METIVVKLRMSEGDQVKCTLQTNGLPFEVVERQLRNFIESLQWQIDERARCPFHAPSDSRQSEEARNGQTD